MEYDLDYYRDDDVYALEFEQPDYPEDEECEYEVEDLMDGDFDSAMASAGFGTDEDYGYVHENDYFDEY